MHAGINQVLLQFVVVSMVVHIFVRVLAKYAPPQAVQL